MKKLAFLIMIVLATSAAWAASKRPAVVKLSEENVTLELTFKNGKKLVVTSKGTKLKAGTYLVKAARLLKRDKKKRLWEMRSAGTLRTLATLTVLSGQEKVLVTGGKIHYAYFIWPNKRDGKLKVLFRFTAQGGYGEVYYPGAYLNRKRPPMPAYRITTGGGKVLAEGRLKLNPSGLGTYSWPVPTGLTENCRIAIKPTMGPFEWEPASKTFSPQPRN